jgi:hypothetical protein
LRRAREGRERKTSLFREMLIAGRSYSACEVAAFAVVHNNVQCGVFQKGIFVSDNEGVAQPRQKLDLDITASKEDKNGEKRSRRERS